MPDDLRDTAIHAAAARYGQEHYRGLLFFHGLRKTWPVAMLASVVILLAWLFRSTSFHLAGALPWLPWIVGGLVALVCTWLLIRRARSPYRRRRW